MKTIACFVVIWITATALLLWQVRHFENHLDLGGAHITWTDNPQSSQDFWHAVWVAAVYSLITTFIVRFWQLVLEMGKKGA